jgi:hypothetical protein
MPWAFISELFCDMASVADGASRCKRLDSCAIILLFVNFSLQK